MSLSEEVLVDARRERRIPVLETERLTLRAPRPEDVKAIALLANDRRIAENTARLPHPYGVERRRTTSSQPPTSARAKLASSSRSTTR